jgi:hypothetical protein
VGLTLARIIVGIVLFCLPVLIFVILSRRPDNALYLLFPLFGAIPAIIAALILFVPLEAYLDARGLPHLKNIAVPLAGAAVVFIFMIVMGVVWGNLGTMFTRLANGGIAAWGAFLVWSVLGALWGLVWRSTEWLAKLVGLANG